MVTVEYTTFDCDRFIDELRTLFVITAYNLLGVMFINIIRRWRDLRSTSNELFFCPKAFAKRLSPKDLMFSCFILQEMY